MQLKGEKFGSIVARALDRSASLKLSMTSIGATKRKFLSLRDSQTSLKSVA